MASTPLFAAQYRTEPTVFVPGFAQRPRLVWRPSGLSGGAGSKITKISLSSGSVINPISVRFGIARRLTLTTNMGGGQFLKNGASPDAISRVIGSFVTDGWRVGDRLLSQEALTLANDFSAILSGVAALSLTLQVGSVNTQEAFDPALTALYRLAWSHAVPVPAGAGSNTAVAVSGLDTTQEPALDPSPDRGLTLGPNEYLVAALGSTLNTNETLDLVCEGQDF